MAHFRFRYLAADGQEISSVGDFSSEDELRRNLDRQGAFLIEARTVKSQAGARGRGFLSPARGFNQGAQIRFLEQMSLMISSGMTISAALHVMERNSSDPVTARISENLACSLAGGTSLSKALEKHCREFSGPVAGLLRMAEATGEAAQCIDRAVDYLHRKRQMRSLVISGMTYPLLMLLMTTGVVCFLVFRIIPKIQQFLQGRNIPLPYATQRLIDFTEFIHANWSYLLGGVLALFVFWWAARRNAWSRLISDRVLLHTPLLGRLIMSSQMAGLCWLISILVRSGQSLVDTLNICADSCGNAEVSRRLRRCSKEVLSGNHSFSAGLQAESFPPLLQECVKVGEATGELSRVLGNMGEFYNRRIQQQVKWASTIFEPLMIVVVGGIVGFVYFSFFQVIFRVATRQ